MLTLSRTLRTTVAVVCTMAASTVWSAPPADLDATINKAITEVGIPGFAVSIVEDGKSTYAKGFGVRRLGGSEPVDADTLFIIGSTSKAFTSAALAILVDEGKIGWDDKVIDHLPGFQMYDPWVTREMTIRDLLVHRSGLGLGQGDLLSIPRTTRSRTDIVHAVRFLKPATSFRSGYAYDNVLYAVAGQLVEAVSGQRWEDFVRDRIFKPAGMTRSTTDERDLFKTDNRVQPHARTDGRIRGMGALSMLDERQGLPQVMAPAGLIASSANDLSHWLAIQLAHGALPGSDKADSTKDAPRLFSAAASKEMWKPQVMTPISAYPPPLDSLTPQYSAYALGWSIEDYRGVKIIQHGGAVLGEQSSFVLIPSLNVGFTMQANSEDGGVVMKGLTYELLDHYLDAPKHDWIADFVAYKKNRVEVAMKALDATTAEAKPSKPSLPLSGYAGNYTDPWYGPISISESKGKLRIDFKQTPNMAATLEHWQYDTFRTQWDDKTIEAAYVTFSLDAAGKVAQITMKAISPLADFSYDFHDLLFTPTASK